MRTQGVRPCVAELGALPEGDSLAKPSATVGVAGESAAPVFMAGSMEPARALPGRTPKLMVVLALLLV